MTNAYAQPFDRAHVYSGDTFVYSLNLLFNPNHQVAAQLLDGQGNNITYEVNPEDLSPVLRRRM